MTSGSTRIRTKPAPSNARRTATDDRPESGIALALLKYFYWIEIGIRSYLRSRDNIEFSRSEGLVIATVMLGHNRPSDIARQLGISRQAIHSTIQQMKGKGILDLVPDPDDGRIKQVVLTAFAAQMNADGVVGMELLWTELGKRVGQVQLKKLADALRSDWGPPVIFDAQGDNDR
ncbi:MAG: MarR family transcriptional regulator [Sphingomicrobium sp.]